MAYDFEKLEIDLREANRIAVERTALMDDGGTANQDSCFLVIKGANEQKVLDAIKAAGLYCRNKSDWRRSKGYFISPKTGGQGNKRNKGVEIMSEYLSACGWGCFNFYRMD
jgi:hypothetical protein